MIKLSRAMVCEVEYHYYYRLCDQRIPCLQGCLGELATLEKCCDFIVHMIHTTIMVLKPLGSGSEAEVFLF